MLPYVCQSKNKDFGMKKLENLLGIALWEMLWKLKDLTLQPLKL